MRTLGCPTRRPDSADTAPPDAAPRRPTAPPLAELGNFALQSLYTSGALRADPMVGAPDYIAGSEAAPPVSPDEVRVRAPSWDARSSAGGAIDAANPAGNPVTPSVRGGSSICADASTAAGRRHSPPARIPQAVKEVLATEAGSPLPDPAGWSRRIGADVSGSRLVTGDRAARAAGALDARAFTLGQRIFLGSHGAAVLGHELIHSAQQRNGRLPAHGLALTSPTDSLEREARSGARHGPTPGPLAIARDDENHEIELASPENSGEYYEQNKMFLWSSARRLIEKTELAIGSPYAKWTYSAQSFFWALQKKLETLSWTELFALTRPSDLDAGIKRARRLYTAGLGPDTAFLSHEEYHVVGKEIAIRINALIPDAVARVVPQFVAATYLAMKEARKRTKQPFESMYPPPPPAAGSIVALASVDKVVIDVILGAAGFMVDVDAEKYEKDGNDPEKSLLHVGIRSFEWQSRSGNPFWIRVTDPPSARPEAVAATLYGDSSKGAAIVAASPLFGFYPQLLTTDQKAAWEATLGAPPPPLPLLNPFDPSAGDPDRWAHGDVASVIQDPAFGVLKGPAAAAAALGQATTKPPTGKGRDEIVKRMRETVVLLDGVRIEADSMNEPGSMVVPVRAVIDDRSKELAAAEGDVEVIKWDAQSQAQVDVVRAAANGVHHAVELYRSFTGTNTPAAAMMKDLAPFLRSALDHAVTAYLLAAVQADLVTTAQATLERADLQSKQFPLDVLDGILNWIRWVLAAPKITLHTIFEGVTDPYRIESMKEMEQKFRARLYEARDLIITDPGKVQAIVDEVQEDIFDLQSAAVVAETMSEVASEMNVLMEEQSAVGSINWAWWVTPIGDFSESKNSEYQRNRDYLSDFYFQFYGISRGILSPFKELRADARQRLRAMQPRVPKLQQALKDIAAMIEERERHEHWITLGLEIVALIAFAIATAGVGSYVSGALLVGAGWGTTTAGVVGAAFLSSGAEAATFTLLSTVILGKDPQHGLLETFLSNWALFGALKGLSLAYEGAIGAEALASLPGKAGNIALGLSSAIGTSLMQQDSQIRASGGKGITQEQATETVVTQLVVFIGTALVGRYAGAGFFEAAYLKGAESPFAEQFRIVETSRAEAFKAALRIKTSGGKIGDAQDALAKDADALAAERALLERIKSEIDIDANIVRRMGLDVQAIQKAEALNALHTDANVRAQIAVELERGAGDMLKCQPGRLDDIVARLRKLGDTVTVTVDPLTGERVADVVPKKAPPMRIAEPASEPPKRALPPPATAAAEQAHIELSQLRAALSPDAQEAFDKIVAQTKDPRQALKQLKKMGDRMDEILSRKTQEARAKAAAAPKVAFGPALDDARALDGEAQQLATEIKDSNLPGLAAWLKRLKPLRAQVEEMTSGEREATPDSVETVRQHVKSIRAELDSAMGHKAEVVNVGSKYTDERGNPVDVDHIYDQGRKWAEVKDYNLFGLESDTFKTDVGPTVQRIVKAAVEARANGDPVEQVTVDMRRGVTQEVKDALEGMGAPGVKVVVEGEVKAPPSPGPKGGGPGPDPAATSMPAPPEQTVDRPLKPADEEGTKSPSQTGQSPKKTVNAPVQGVYESVEPAKSSASSGLNAVDTAKNETQQWQFEDEQAVADRDNPGFQVRRTNVRVTLTNNATGVTRTVDGYIIRSYDPRTNTLLMKKVRLDALPSKINAGTPMTEAGTPTLTYLTIRQMKAFGIGYAAAPTVVLKNIWNVRAILELNTRTAKGMKPADAIAETNSYAYTKTVVTQAGNRIQSVQIRGGKTGAFKEVLDFWETDDRAHAPDPRTVERHNKLISELGEGKLGRDSEVFFDFDIIIGTAPW